MDIFITGFVCQNVFSYYFRVCHEELKGVLKSSQSLLLLFFWSRKYEVNLAGKLFIHCILTVVLALPFFDNVIIVLLTCRLSWLFLWRILLVFFLYQFVNNIFYSVLSAYVIIFILDINNIWDFFCSKLTPERNRLPRCVQGAGGLLPRYNPKQSQGQQYLYMVNDK